MGHDKYYNASRTISNKLMFFLKFKFFTNQLRGNTIELSIFGST